MPIYYDILPDSTNLTNQIINFDNRFIILTKNIFPTWYHIPLTLEINDNNHYRNIKFLQVKSSINTANIYQLNDEWFWVFIYDINDMNIIGSGRSWKCDQLEGLVTLLKDNIN